MFSLIIKEYPNQESNLSQELTEQFRMAITMHFFDIIYSCILVLKSTDE